MSAESTKSHNQQKSHFLQVRISDAEKDAFDRAAQLSGVEVSVWVVERLRIVASREIFEAGERPAFLARSVPHE